MTATDLDQSPRITDVTLLKLARELAMEIHPIETILSTHKVSRDQWEEIQRLPRFQAILTSELAAWHGATNTPERVKVKAAAMIEEWLPELYSRMHDRQETLNSKVEAGKLVRDLAGFVKGSVGGEGLGEKFSVTINLGADAQLTFEKSAVTPKVIEGEVVS